MPGQRKTIVFVEPIEDLHIDELDKLGRPSTVCLKERGSRVFEKSFALPVTELQAGDKICLTPTMFPGLADDPPCEVQSIADFEE